MAWLSGSGLTVGWTGTQVSVPRAILQNNKNGFNITQTKEKWAMRTTIAKISNATCTCRKGYAHATTSDNIYPRSSL